MVPCAARSSLTECATHCSSQTMIMIKNGLFLVIPDTGVYDSTRLLKSGEKLNLQAFVGTHKSVVNKYILENTLRKHKN